MVRTNKNEKPSSAPSNTPSAVASEKPVVAEKTKKTTAPKSKAVDVPATTTAPVTTTAAPVVASTSGPLSDTETLAVKLNVFGAKLQQLSGLFSSVKTDFKILEKIVSRELKNAQKSSMRKKKSSGNRAPSGFVKPTRISDELAQFLGKTIGTEMARTDVSKEINAYIRSNNLQDKANGRKINADSKLSTLLKLSKEDELTYFNLQRFMKHHFIKAEEIAAATV
jgi:chromatin remodeling complex protein RSC6